jgi:hypothetical protein
MFNTCIFLKELLFVYLVDVNATGNDYANTLVYDKSDPVATLAWKDTDIMDRYTREYSRDGDDLRYANGWHLHIFFLSPFYTFNNTFLVKKD